MISTNRLEIRGATDCYRVDLTDSSSILKPNGEVCSTYLGISEKTGRRVVVKRYHQWVTNSPEYSWRIEREAHAAADCSAITSELVVANGIYYLILEYIDGLSFRDITRWRYRRKLSHYDLITLSIKALRALHTIHRAGYVHCDIKPSNIWVETTDPKNIEHANVRIIDFGMVRFPAEPLQGGERKLPFALIYSAPEQLLNLWELVGIQTDIYSMGVTLWQLFALTEPWLTDNPLKTIHIQLTQDLPKCSRISPNLMAVIRRATSKPMLKKPPHYFSRAELKQLVEQSVSLRHPSAEAFISDLLMPMW